MSCALYYVAYFLPTKAKWCFAGACVPFQVACFESYYSTRLRKQRCPLCCPPRHSCKTGNIWAKESQHTVILLKHWVAECGKTVFGARLEMCLPKPLCGVLVCAQSLARGSPIVHTTFSPSPLPEFEPPSASSLLVSDFSSTSSSPSRTAPSEL